MKISVDAGALCADKNHRFGNFIFTENFLKALTVYDRKQKYFFYTFCDKPKTKNLQPKLFWSKLRVSIEELISKKDYYFALNQSLPIFTPAKIISFSHGLAFHFFSQLYPDSARKMEGQHKEMINRSAKIIVPSIKVKKELVDVYRPDESKIVVIPYGVPLDMTNKVQNTKLKVQRPNKFFLAVGMGHPIKNQKILPADKYKFVIANNISRRKLRRFYQEAIALVTTSFYESFNLPVLEALALGCPVIGLNSAIIPELAPYVNLCKNESELSFMMEKAKQKGLPKPDTKEIKEKFSWKKYVTKIRTIVT